MNVTTFQADEDDQVFVLDTDVTAFCIQCLDPDDGTADSDITWVTSGGMSLCESPILFLSQILYPISCYCSNFNFQ